MNKTNKRYMNLRNKLFAAIAMLLVSSIMMVSSTYAWFTLSTAPEVQGITTTVGTNGNLEIALSPLTGETGTISTNVSDSTKDWIVKNTTWGNLLDLSHAEYELDKVVLQPSQMAFKTAEGGYAVDNAGLAYPVYGSDGRISKLDKGSYIGVKQPAATGTNRTLTEGFQLSGTGFGVRAVGTSSGQTENERVYNSGLNALRNGINQAAGVASSAMNDNGQALANMMVEHAMAGKFNTAENFEPYKGNLEALVASLEKSVENMDAALKGFLTAYVATQETGAKLTAAVTAIESAKDISALITELKVSNAELSAALTARDAIAGKVASARTALNAITVWDWEGVAGVVNQLMNVNYVTINGLTYAQITGSGEEDGIGKLVQSIMNNGSTATIMLNEGSGIYYDIHKMASKIYASTKMAVDAGKVMSGMGVIEVNTIIETSYSGITILGAAQTFINTQDPATEEEGSATSVSKLDVYYGYILDFVFRTNAADSDLLLQTEAANRVYTDGGEATMGAGSTISFQVPTGVNDGIVKGMLDGIRVVFFNTVDGTVYGVAKATSATAETNDLGTTWTGKLQLCDYDVDEGLVTVNEALESAVLCDLNQNQPQRVSVMVSLDGNDITNADILAEGNLTGTLNLQFASSANLVPMVNTDLKTMESYDVKLGGTKIGTVEQNGNFTYKLDPAKVQSVAVTMGEGNTAVNDAYNAETGVITITNATGEVNITVVQKVPATTATPESSNGEATTEPTTAPSEDNG